jgi:hypothetical protein
LQQHPADFGKARREPFEDFRRGRDRIGGSEANTAANGAEAVASLPDNQRRQRSARWGELLVE